MELYSVFGYVMFLAFPISMNVFGLHEFGFARVQLGCMASRSCGSLSRRL